MYLLIPNGDLLSSYKLELYPTNPNEIDAQKNWTFGDGSSRTCLCNFIRVSWLFQNFYIPFNLVYMLKNYGTLIVF